MRKYIILYIAFFSYTFVLYGQIPHLQEIINNTLEEANKSSELINIPLNDLIRNEKLRHQSIVLLNHLFMKHYNVWNSYDDFQNTVISDTSFSTSLKTQFVDSNLWSIKIWKKKRDSLFFAQWELFFALLQIDSNIYNKSIIEANISIIKNPYTLQFLLSSYEEKYDQPAHDYLTESIISRNTTLLKKQLSKIEQQRFVNYKSNSTIKQAIKEIDVYLDNDIFMPANYNKDCDYTGGGKITISTDYFAPMWLSPAWIRNINNRNDSRIYPKLLSYQSIGFGLTSFTPYIHYRNNYNLADTLFQHDRPFGSYVYCDISKFRLWPKGLIRHHGSFQIGAIGTNAGKAMQTTLHKAYGWEKQIANGGRWLIQLNHEADFLLYSNTNKFKSVFNPNKTNSSLKNFGLNIIGIGEINWGGYISSLGSGLKLSSTDFLKQSGTQNIKPFKNSEYKFAIKIDASLKYRYIIHNSLLEGYGYWTTFTDEIKDDDKNVVYTMNDEYYNQQNKILLGNERRYNRTPKAYDNVNRHIFLFDYGINIRFREMILYYYMGFYTREYKLNQINYYNLVDLVNYNQQDYYLNEVIPQLQDYSNQKIYGYGRIGVSWIINSN